MMENLEETPRPNMLSNRLNKKSSRTFHPAALTFSASPTEIRHENPDVQGDKPVCNDAGELYLDDRAK